MKSKGQIKLYYPEEFKIACKINNLKPEEVIQFFIDHVCFYAFIGGNMEPVYLWATAVSVACKEAMGRPASTITDPEIQEISLKYIRKLTLLSQQTNLTIAGETSSSVSLMKEWAAEMLPLTDYPTSITTSTGAHFTLSFDFNLLCRLNGLDTALMLQFFADSISLARERAANLSGTVEMEPGLAVLLLLVANVQEIRHRILPQQEIYRKFGIQLLKLDKKQQNEDDPERRLTAYSDFYRDWYHALNQQTDPL